MQSLRQHKSSLEVASVRGKQNSSSTVKKQNAKPSNQPIVQPKLELTQPGDRYEQEADRMADFVMRKQFDNAVMPSTTSVLPPVISRNTDTGSGIAIDTATEHGINALSGGGLALPDSLRSQMESGFGTDFSNVRLHTDSQAAQLSQNINAKAFTYGNDIYFNKGQYNPTADSGQHLIAHELTHVVQQNGKVGREENKKEQQPKNDNNKFAQKVAKMLSDYLTIPKMEKYVKELQNWDAKNYADRKQVALKILSDKELKGLKQEIVNIIGESSDIAVLSSMIAGLTLIVAKDIPVKGSWSQKIGAGFSGGVSFDLESIKDLKINNLSGFVSYNTEYLNFILRGILKANKDIFYGFGFGGELKYKYMKLKLDTNYLFNHELKKINCEVGIGVDFTILNNIQLKNKLIWLQENDTFKGSISFNYRNDNKRINIEGSFKHQKTASEDAENLHQYLKEGNAINFPLIKDEKNNTCFQLMFNFTYFF